MYALDTNSVSCFLKGQGRVAERLLALSPSRVALPAVVLYELAYGAGRSEAPRGLRERLEVLLSTLPVLPFGEAEARAAARVRLSLEKTGQSIGPLDLLIAATAIEHNAVLVTHNVKEFRRVRGLRVEDWY
jgi:tRNA(fMet)-specific endonuclease VapC